MTQTTPVIFSAKTVPLDPRDQIDIQRLTAWMSAEVAGFTGPIEVVRFEGGQSNPTFLIRATNRNYVLRRKPLGETLPSAHAVDREFRVMSALHAQGFSVPHPYALCMDDTVLQRPFYVMEAKAGRIFWNQQLPDLTPQERGSIYRSQAETLAQLHRIDLTVAGLQDYGRPGNYFERQVNRWIKQYRAAQTHDVPEMERLIDWLPRTLPAQQGNTLVHGDYQLHNIMMHQTEPRVLAVLDWELSTTGDPLADLSYMLMQWISSGGPQVGLRGADLGALGIPDMTQVIEIYSEKVGRSEVPDLDWYFAFNLFRLASIAQGIISRIKAGTAASAQANVAAERFGPMVRLSLDYAERAGS